MLFGDNEPIGRHARRSDALFGAGDLFPAPDRSSAADTVSPLAGSSAGAGDPFPLADALWAADTVPPLADETVGAIDPLPVADVPLSTLEPLEPLEPFEPLEPIASPSVPKSSGFEASSALASLFSPRSAKRPGEAATPQPPVESTPIESAPADASPDTGFFTFAEEFPTSSFEQPFPDLEELPVEAPSEGQPLGLEGFSAEAPSGYPLSEPGDSATEIISFDSLPSIEPGPLDLPEGASSPEEFLFRELTFEPDVVPEPAPYEAADEPTTVPDSMEAAPEQGFYDIDFNLDFKADSPVEASDASAPDAAVEGEAASNEVVGVASDPELLGIDFGMEDESLAVGLAPDEPQDSPAAHPAPAPAPAVGLTPQPVFTPEPQGDDAAAGESGEAGKSGKGFHLPKGGKLSSLAPQMPPTKRTINLIEATRRRVNRRSVAIVAVVAAAVLIAVGKFGIYDPFSQMIDAQSRASELRSEVAAANLAIESMGDLFDKYAHYTYSGMTEDELARTDRMEILDMIERTIMPNASLASWTVSGNTLTTSITASSLQDISAIAQLINAEDIVNYCSVTTATNNSASSGRAGGMVTANITVYLNPDEEGVKL